MSKSNNKKKTGTRRGTPQGGPRRRHLLKPRPLRLLARVVGAREGRGTPRACAGAPRPPRCQPPRHCRCRVPTPAGDPRLTRATPPGGSSPRAADTRAQRGGADSTHARPVHAPRGGDRHAAVPTHEGRAGHATSPPPSSPPPTQGKDGPHRHREPRAAASVQPAARDSRPDVRSGCKQPPTAAPTVTAAAATSRPAPLPPPPCESTARAGASEQGTGGTHASAEGGDRAPPPQRRTGPPVRERESASRCPATGEKGPHGTR